MKLTPRHRSLRLRAMDGEANIGRLTGVGTVFDASYRIAPNRTETVAPEAFITSLRENPVMPIFWSHGWAKDTNETPIGIARLRSTEFGIEIESAQLNMSNAKAQDVWFAVTADEEGGAALREWSLGFIATEIKEREQDGVPDDYILRGDLLEISVTLRGAAVTYMGADRSDQYAMREAEYLALREAEIESGIYEAAAPAASGAGNDDAGSENEPVVETVEEPTGSSEETAPVETDEVTTRQLQLLRDHPGFRAAVRAQITDTA